jgi:hypothetical protein
MNVVIQNFKEWLQIKEALFKQAGLKYEVSETPDGVDDEVAIWVDFDSPRYLSRITLWDTGLCVLEVLDSESGKNVMLEQLELAPSDQLNDSFEEFVSILTR